MSRPRKFCDEHLSQRWYHFLSFGLANHLVLEQFHYDRGSRTAWVGAYDIASLRPIGKMRQLLFLIRPTVYRGSLYPTLTILVRRMFCAPEPFGGFYVLLIPTRTLLISSLVLLFARVLRVMRIGELASQKVFITWITLRMNRAQL